MDIFIDIETLRAPESVRKQILEDTKSNFKAPSTLSKGQAAEDLGLDSKSDEVKYTSKDDMIKRWESELAEEKSSGVADEKWAKTSFDPNVAPIACIVIGWLDGADCYQEVKFNQSDMVNEAEILSFFHACVVDVCRGTLPNFIGHNIGKFDLPFIWKRSIINGVSPAKGVNWMNGRHGQHYFDTMIAWAGFGGTISADKLAGVLGVKGKSDIDGSMVYDLWQEDPIKVIDYCADDVRMVRDIYKKLTK